MTATKERSKRVRSKVPVTRSPAKGKDTESTLFSQKKAAIEAAYGSLSWVDYSVDEYLREKREEVKRENGE